MDLSNPSNDGAKPIGPWRRLSVRPVYSNPWIAVEHHEVLRPDGLPGIYGVVNFHHAAIGVVPLDEEGYTWLVGQHRYALDEYSWEIPEGGAEAHEVAGDAAARELSEEVGLTASRWVDLGRVHTSNSVCNESGRVFLAQGITVGKNHPEGTEQLQIRRLPFAEALEMAARGDITDCISVVALFRAERYLASSRP